MRHNETRGQDATLTVARCGHSTILFAAHSAEKNEPALHHPTRIHKPLLDKLNPLNKLLLPVLLATFSLSPGSFAALPMMGGDAPVPSLAPMLEKIQAAVVNLSTTTHLETRQNPLMQDPFFRRFFDLPQPHRRSRGSLGSGVIVDAEKGYIVTNHHLIDQADEITVTTEDGRTLRAELVGSDADSDIAVIQVDGERLSEIPLGNSATLRVGDFVVAIGNPFGLSQTVTSGIISALGRSGLGIEGYEDFIQTDAAINPGNSGGALVDWHGRLIGINTAIFSRGGGSVGIGFAIPIDMVKELMAQLVEHGDVRRGLLGVTMQDLTPSLAEAFGLDGMRGAVVSQVIADSAAQEVGVRAGDVIVRFNDTLINDSADLRNAVGLLRAGSKARVQFYRDGKLKTVHTQIRELGGFAWREQGLSGRFAGARLRAAEPNSVHDGGVEVTELQPGSPAQRFGLAENDIILSLNRRRVKTPKEMEQAVKGNDGALLIKLLRDERMLFLVVQ